MQKYRVIYTLFTILLTTLLFSCSHTPLTSISITPEDPSVATTATKQFTATGHYVGFLGRTTTTDITSSATWTSNTTAVATINAAGLATGMNAGTTTITATDAVARSVFVSGTDVYVAGNYSPNDGSCNAVATVWKNGTRTNLSDVDPLLGSAQANSVYVNVHN